MSCAEGTGEDLVAFLKLCQPLSEIIKVFSVELAKFQRKKRNVRRMFFWKLACFDEYQPVRVILFPSGSVNEGGNKYL